MVEEFASASADVDVDVDVMVVARSGGEPCSSCHSQPAVVQLASESKAAQNASPANWHVDSVTIISARATENSVNISQS
jgi:hypothetical protein